MRKIKLESSEVAFLNERIFPGVDRMDLYRDFVARFGRNVRSKGWVFAHMYRLQKSAPKPQEVRHISMQCRYANTLTGVRCVNTTSHALCAEHKHTEQESVGYGSSGLNDATSGTFSPRARLEGNGS